MESTQGGVAKVDLGCRMSEVPRMELLELKRCCCLLWGMPSCLKGLQWWCLWIFLQELPCQELGLLVFGLGGNVPSCHVKWKGAA